LSNNNKVENAEEIMDELEVDIVAYNEHHLNMQDQQNVNGFNQLFKGGETAIQLVVEVERRKEGQALWSLNP
jgi:hypothetical protein